VINKRKIVKIIIGLTVLGGAVAYFLYGAINSSWVYYYTVDEFVAGRPGDISGKSSVKTAGIRDNCIIRLAGRVKDGSISRNMDKMQLKFELAGQKGSVPVRFNGMVPKNFADGKEVVVEGKVGESGIFEAKKILTRCESKYKVKL